MPAAGDLIGADQQCHLIAVNRQCGYRRPFQPGAHPGRHHELFAGGRTAARRPSAQCLGEPANPLQVSGLIGGVPEVHPDPGRQQRRQFDVPEQDGDQPLAGLDRVAHQHRVLVAYVRGGERGGAGDQRPGLRPAQPVVQGVHDDVPFDDLVRIQEHPQAQPLQVVGEDRHPAGVVVRVGKERVEVTCVCVCRHDSPGVSALRRCHPTPGPGSAGSDSALPRRADPPLLVRADSGVQGVTVLRLVP